MDTTLEVQKGTIDISLIFRKINDYTAEEIAKIQEKGTDNGQTR